MNFVVSKYFSFKIFGSLWISCKISKHDKSILTSSIEKVVVFEVCCFVDILKLL